MLRTFMRHKKLYVLAPSFGVENRLMENKVNRSCILVTVKIWGISIPPNGRLQSLRIFRRFPVFWRAPISPNFKLKKDLVESYILKARERLEPQSFLRMYFIFLSIFIAKREQKLTKQAKLTLFLTEYPSKGVITCRFEWN